MNLDHCLEFFYTIVTRFQNTKISAFLFELESREISFRGAAPASIKRWPLVLILEIVERQPSESLLGGGGEGGLGEAAISQQYTRGRGRGRRGAVGKRFAHGGIVSRRRSQISSPDSFVDAGRARAIESKGFPVCCSSIGEQSLR